MGMIRVHILLSPLFYIQVRIKKKKNQKRGRNKRSRITFCDHS